MTCAAVSARLRPRRNGHRRCETPWNVAALCGIAQDAVHVPFARTAVVAASEAQRVQLNAFRFPAVAPSPSSVESVAASKTVQRRARSNSTVLQADRQLAPLRRGSILTARPDVIVAGVIANAAPCV